MVRRIFWMAVGAGATVWAMNKANEAVHRLTPDSLSGTAARGALHLGDLAKQFARDVQAGMAEREEQLKDDLGLHGTAVVEPRGDRRSLLGKRSAPPPPASRSTELSRRRPVARPPPCLRPAAPAPRPGPLKKRPAAPCCRGAAPRTGRTTNGVG